MKVYLPDKFWKLPRWLETLIQSFIFVSVLVIFCLLKLDELLWDMNVFSSNVYYVIFVQILMFYFYKVMSTHSAVDKLIIDGDIREITITYWWFYFIKKKKIIKFEEFSFWTNDDTLLFGSSKSIRIYQNNKYKIKLNARNSWKKEQIEEITNEFLLLTNGKKRIKPKWYV